MLNEIIIKIDTFLSPASFVLSLSVYFAPILFLILVIKLYAGKKFGNKLFYSLFIPVFILFFYPLISIFYPFLHNPKHPIFIAISEYSVLVFYLLNWTIIISLPLIFIYSMYKFFKEKNGEIFVKTAILTIICSFLLYLGYPLFISKDQFEPVWLRFDYKSYQSTNIEQQLKDYMRASDSAIFKPLKYCYAEIIVYSLRDFNKLSFKNNNEAIEIYNKYLDIVSEVEGINPSFADFYVKIGQYDKALEVIDKSQERFPDENFNMYRTYIYIEKGDFETARKLLKDYELIKPGSYREPLIIYFHFNDMEKFKELLDEFQRRFGEKKEMKYPTTYLRYYRSLCVYYYKQNDSKTAKEVYEEYLKDKEKIKKNSFDEYIKNLVDNYVDIMI